MRNLNQYPVTKEEITELLRNESARVQDEMRIGDMRSILLRMAADIVEQHAVEIMKLDWEQEDDQHWSAHWEGNHWFLSYNEMSGQFYLKHNRESIVSFDTFEEAQDYAQETFEKRVRKVIK